MVKRSPPPGVPKQCSTECGGASLGLNKGNPKQPRRINELARSSAPGEKIPYASVYCWPSEGCIRSALRQLSARKIIIQLSLQHRVRRTLQQQ
mmetsp:Transcript_6614/g.21359  ORF Transcript_6614/g.21359 Transcript_6614/m.21359 type:complete len:93 (+) Transcript_6614:482-760(+)